jgi:hypothetical protein
MKPHMHCESIKAWAGGARIQWRTPGTSVWIDCIHMPEWSIDREYRVKPPEPNYPTTQLPHADMARIMQMNGNVPPEGWRQVANAALRHACDAGQVVRREEFDRAIGERKTRDAAIADAVMQEAASIVESMAAGLSVTLADMLAVAAEKVRSTAVADIIQRAAP